MLYEVITNLAYYAGGLFSSVRMRFHNIFTFFYYLTAKKDGAELRLNILRWLRDHCGGNLGRNILQQLHELFAGDGLALQQMLRELVQRDFVFLENLPGTLMRSIDYSYNFV